MDAAAEADSDGTLGHAVHIVRSEVDHVIAIAAQGDVVAIVEVGPEVHRGEGDEPAAGVVIDHQAVVGHHVLLVVGDGDAQADIACEVQVSEAFGEGDERTELTATTPLEDLAVARRDVEGETRREDELVRRVVDQRVFEAGGQIHPAIHVETGGVDVKVAVLRRDEGEAVRQRIADLQRVERGMTTTGDEVVVQRVIDEIGRISERITGSSKKIGFVTGAMVCAFQSTSTGAGFFAATGAPALALERDTAAIALTLSASNHRFWECGLWSMREPKHTGLRIDPRILASIDQVMRRD